MIKIKDYIQDFYDTFLLDKASLPWEITKSLMEILNALILKLNGDFKIEENIAIHKSAVIETGVILKGPAIVSENCFIGAHGYFRGGVFLGTGTTIGPACEVKTSVIMHNSSIAHFNFIGDSIVGSNVNFEAGAVTANHFNERKDKQIHIIHDAQVIATNTTKFGSLVGDHSRIGANAVLSPGTILGKNSIVKRLELVEQYVGNASK